MAGTALRASDVDALVVGLRLLGSGGGGDPEALGATLRRALGARELRLHAPDELDDAHVVPVGIFGSTPILAEKLPGGTEIVDAVAALARWTGQRPEAVMPAEAAGLNGSLAVAAAIALDLPLVDADLMGRALPRIDQTTRAVTGGALTPFAMAEPTGRIVLIDRSDPVDLERMVRGLVAQGAGWSTCAFAPVPASGLAADSCLGSLARALTLGRAHATMPIKPGAAQVAAALGGRLLAAGRVLEIARHSSGTFGRAGIGVLDDTGPVLRLEAENEYLLAMVDGEPVASCPDLLCVLDRRTATPIAVDTLRVGDGVTVLVLPGPPWWRARPDRLAHVAPRAFGLDCDPVLLPEPIGVPR